MVCVNSFETLKLNKEFQQVYRRGKSAHARSCVLFYLPQGGVRKVGYTASKKVGNAVVRNRSKRRFRALFSEFADRLRDGSYVLVAKESMNQTPYDVLKRDFKKLLIRTGGMADGKNASS